MNLRSVPVLSAILFFTFSIEAQNVGVGTTTPASKLDVNGGVTIGSTYSGTNAAPPDGAIIKGQVGIGTNIPNGSAALDVTSTTQGVLFPRMATRPSSPANGLIIFNTTNNCLEFYVGGFWQPIACGCTSVPTSPTSISGTFTNLCKTPNTNAYSTPAIYGASSYTWGVTGDASATISGNGNNTVTVTYSGTTGTALTVYATNACGNSASTYSQAITFAAAPAAPTANTNPSLCNGVNGTYIFNSVNGVTYNCTLTGTGNTINGNNANSTPVSVTAAGSTTSITLNAVTAGTVTITPYNCNTTGTPLSQAISFTPVPAAPTANTNPSLCTGVNGTYIFNSVNGVTYNCTLTGTGNTINGANANSTPVSVTAAGATTSITLNALVAGSVTITPYNCNGNGTALTQALTFTAVPAAATWNTNPATVCASTNTTYTFNSVNGVTYNVTLTGTGNTVNGTNATVTPVSLTAAGATTSFTANLAVAGTVSVTAYNCNGSATPITQAVAIYATPGAPALTAATNVGVVSTAFTANWTAPSGTVSGYLLDVSTSSSFGSFVGTYNALNVGNVLTYSVTGLTCGITYYYRVRAYVCTTSNASAYPTTPAYQSATPFIHGTITWSSSYGSWTVPCGVTSVTVDMAGAGGGQGYSTVAVNTQGYGARIVGTISSLTPGSTVYYGVGAQGATPTSSTAGGAGGTGGYNGDSKGGTGFGSSLTDWSTTPGYGTGGGGGGASDLRIGGTALTNRIISAGGGGGACDAGNGGNAGQPGAAGTGYGPGNPGASNAGGAQVAAYNAGGCTGQTVGAAGTTGLGGNGGLGTTCNYYGGGGGGGGMGGGSGGSGAGGGGGYTYTSGTGVSGTVTAGYQAGAGYITLTW